MPKKLVVNTGFITNSSACVYHFDKSMLEHPKVQAFIEAYEIDKGFVGSDLWHRGQCSSVILTDEQKEEARQKFKKYDYGNVPGVADEPEKGTIVYGDEYVTLASQLAHLLDSISDECEGKISHGTYFN